MSKIKRYTIKEACLSSSFMKKINWCKEMDVERLEENNKLYFQRILDLEIELKEQKEQFQAENKELKKKVTLEEAREKLDSHTFYSNRDAYMTALLDFGILKDKE